MNKLIPQFIKNIYHLSQAILANLIYGFPSKNIKVIGVTGTNGKTTVVQMIAKILEEAGRKVALASTINFKIGGKEWVNETKFTTLSSFKIQKFIKQAVKAGCEYLVLEVSSHSLDQNRVWGIKFDTAVITNITREHFDYHKNMEKYRRAKLKLFKKAKNAVVNLDIGNAEEFLKYGENKYGYTVKIPISLSRRPAGKFQIPNKSQISNFKFQKITAEDIQLSPNYSKFKIQNSKFILNLLGKFNIENALAATGAGLAENISLEKIKNALEKIKNIPGRMEYVPNDKNLNIIIDYAVTPDSLEKLYGLINSIKGEKSNVISVFGACGERDRGKRPIMGEIVSRYADYIILTNEDPYGENPVQIINEVFSGVVGYEVKSEIPNFQFSIFNFQSIYNDQISNGKKGIEGKNCWRILDRREAIRFALKLAQPGDYVIATGKGAETSMAVGNKKIPWNDRKVILEVLQELK